MMDTDRAYEIQGCRIRKPTSKRKFRHNLTLVNRVYFKDSFTFMLSDLKNTLSLHETTIQKHRSFGKVDYSISAHGRKLAHDFLADEIEFYKKARETFFKQKIEFRRAIICVQQLFQSIYHRTQKITHNLIYKP